LNKVSKHNCSTQTDDETKKAVSSQSTNLKDKRSRTAETPTRSYEASYRSKRLKLDKIISDEEDETEQEKNDVNSKCGLRLNNQLQNVSNNCVDKENKTVPGKAPKRNHNQCWFFDFLADE